MLDIMKQAIDALKSKVAINLEEIRKNETRFRILFSEGRAKENSEELNSIIEMNKNLLAENFDFINVQIAILKFMEKYQYSEVFQSKDENLEEEQEMSDQIDFFEPTISGQMPFNSKHPLFHDEVFFGRLMSYYESIEAYEMCSELLKSKAMENRN